VRHKIFFQKPALTYISFFQHLGKGQLISKGLFGVIVSTKKNNEFFLRIFALASKRVQIKNIYYINMLNSP
jgi:hypothetical protein